MTPQGDARVPVVIDVAEKERGVPVKMIESRPFSKATLPTKACVGCGRPFQWRKKWSRVWDAVKFCSDRCRSSKRERPATTGIPKK